jgi:hypothetical protein
VKKISNGESIVGNDLLDRIDRKISQWWGREYDEAKRLVCMNGV